MRFPPIARRRATLCRRAGEVSGRGMLLHAGTNSVASVIASTQKEENPNPYIILMVKNIIAVVSEK